MSGMNQRGSSMNRPDGHDSGMSESIKKSIEGKLTNAGMSPNKGQTGTQGTGGIQYFESFKQDLREGVADKEVAVLDDIDGNIDQILDTKNDIDKVLGTFTQKLVSVLSQHEEDFIYAYKMHMVKIEKELQILKAKGAEQETKLSQDVRIVQLEKQLKWFKNEFKGLIKVKDRNELMIEEKREVLAELQEEGEDSTNKLKASKRQNKLMTVALKKAEQYSISLQMQSTQLGNETSHALKQAVVQPSLLLSPFLPFDQQKHAMQMLEMMTTEEAGETELQQREDETFSRQMGNIQEQIVNRDLQAASRDESTEMNQDIEAVQQSGNYRNIVQPSGDFQNMDTENAPQIPQQENYQQDEESAQPMEEVQPSVLSQYVIDLVQSGREQKEVTGDLQTYFHQISEHCNSEILELQEQLELEKAAFREEQADEVIMKADEMEELSNMFIDCIHEQRKSLRQQLLKIKNKQGQQTNQMFDQESEYGSTRGSGSLNKLGPGGRSQKFQQPNLLETYLRIVKTGAPEEIERFSQIERQKLVELLVTNTDLLNFMFDKMFRNNYDPKEREQLLSQQTLSDSGTAAYLEQMQDNTELDMHDTLELLQRSTDLRKAHQQSSPGRHRMRPMESFGATGVSNLHTGVRNQPFHSRTKASGVKFQRPVMPVPTEKQLLDRKQQSMAAGVISGAYMDDTLNSPLQTKTKNGMAVRQNTLRGYDSLNQTPLQGATNKLPKMQREKIASDFSQQNVVQYLSKVDTDRMQNQYLSHRDTEQTNKPSQQSQLLQDINERDDQESMRKSSNSDLKASKKFMQHLKVDAARRRGQSGSGRPDIKQNINAQSPHIQSSYYATENAESKPTVDIPKLLLKQKKSQKLAAANQNKPLMHVKNGKLVLIMGK